MRDEIKKVVTEEIITIQDVATLLDANPVLIYRYVVTDGICEHLRIGRSHVVIDRADLELVRERVNRSTTSKRNRKGDK